MKRYLTLREMRAEGRDPLSILGADRALLLDHAWLSRVEAGAPMMFWGEDDDEADEAPAPTPYELADGVAVIDVEGPIAQRGWLCMDGYDTIARDLEHALNNPGVRAALLRINSPGGAAAGAFEWTGRMRDLVVASGKRVIAYADEMAFSGAYAVACVADEIVVPETGAVGSVGVVAGMVSWAKANEKNGVDVRVIHAGAEKVDGCPNLPIDDAAVARAQRDVDALAGVFNRWVGSRRRMGVEAVAALEAGTRTGPEAVTSGLADRVLGFHALLAEMQQAAARSNTAPAKGRTTTARAAVTRTMDENLQALCAATGIADPNQALSAVTALYASVAELTGKTSPDEQIGALSALSVKASGYDAAIARAEKAEKALGDTKLDQLIARGISEGKLTPAQCAAPDPAEGRPAGWARRQSPESLEAFLADAPRVVPAGEIKQPDSSTTTGCGMPEDVAVIVAKASESGWRALTDAEKHRITKHDTKLAARLRGAKSAA